MEAFEQFIPRQIDEKGVEHNLNTFSRALDSLVDFGSNIVKWDVQVNRGQDDNLPIILSLRHYLELMDGVSILIQKASCDPSKLLLRGALETYFGLEYIFEKNTKERCMSFLVWHAHQRMKTYRKYDNSAKEGKQFESVIKNDKVLPGFSLPVNPGIPAAVANLESLLQLPLYQSAEAEYQRLISVGIKNPAWYRLYNGPQNLGELAKRLNLSLYYEVLYRDWSGPTHGTDILQGKLFSNAANTADIVQIRYVRDAQSVTSWAFTLSIRMFQTFIDNRLPDKKDELKKWYLTVREFYNRVSGKDQLIKVV